MDDKRQNNNLITIPNILSIVRILMIPLIIWVYYGLQKFIFATCLIITSGFTDIVDGFIARKFNMESNLGKILDPLADKLTQIAIFICLASKYHLILLLILLFVIKEIVLVVFGLITIKNKNVINSSKWYGKITTIFIYFTIAVLILLPNIPHIVANILICICILFVVFSMINYVIFYTRYLS